MFKKILIATDLSESSDAVINCMKDFKTLGVEEVILFYACGIDDNDTLAEYTKDFYEPDLLKQQKIIENQGFVTTLEIVPGGAYEELKKVAKRTDVSLIIIGSQEVNAYNQILNFYGNVNSEILHVHEKPLLMISTNVIENDGKRTFVCLNKNLNDRILFATDFSDISMRAFTYVEKMVEDGCKKVTLFHVHDKVKRWFTNSDQLKEFNRIDTERLEVRRQLLLDKGAEEVEIKILVGTPSVQILKESKNDYTLIVMGSQGKGFLQDIFIGRVSQSVARKTKVSLLLIPPADREIP